MGEADREEERRERREWEVEGVEADREEKRRERREWEVEGGGGG